MTCWCSLAALSLLYCCALRFLFLDSVDLRYRRPGVGVQCCQVVPHHAGAVLRPHLQTLRLPEGQPLPPRPAAKSENWNTASHYKLAALTAASQSGCLIFFFSIMFLRKMSVQPGKHGCHTHGPSCHFLCFSCPAGSRCTVSTLWTRVRVLVLWNLLSSSFNKVSIESAPSRTWRHLEPRTCWTWPQGKRTQWSVHTKHAGRICAVTFWTCFMNECQKSLRYFLLANIRSWDFLISWMSNCRDVIVICE